MQGMAQNTTITKRVCIPGDGIHKQENRLKILETSDGDLMVSIETYHHETGQYSTSGVVHFKSGHTGGRKQVLFVSLRKVLDQALELKKMAPMSRIEGWGEK